ncbi:bifunctional DNA-formamidopyrimidine glycosylase/DNA-(apurinic or apyrimidinic site) lyase [Salinifilum aidingensis]
MPELPEVEVVRSGVDEHVAGRTIAAVEVLHPRAVRRHVPGADDFAARTVGRRVRGVRRRGKYLWCELGAEEQPTAADAGFGDSVVVHLGMSGQLLVQPSGAADERHLRVRFRFADGGPELRFVDQRTFGGLHLAELVPAAGLAVPKPIEHIAVDPLEEAFDLAALTERLRARRTGVKRALLDQGLVSGIGNIYADEALWRAQLHWARPTATMNRPAVHRLFDAVTAVMREALEAGGTSFDELYVDVNGESGYFERSLSVYGRTGLPCPRCGAAVRRDVFMNRSAYSCPACQPRPRNAHY